MRRRKQAVRLNNVLQHLIPRHSNGHGVKKAGIKGIARYARGCLDVVRTALPVAPDDATLHGALTLYGV